MHTNAHLTHAAWHTTEHAEGTLHWRGYPDSLEALGAALATAVPTHSAPQLDEIAGHWCAVLETPAGFIAAQDPIRSWPLFVASSPDGARVITDSIDYAREHAGDPAVDRDFAAEFANLGYVTGRDTLFAGIEQIQPGGWMVAPADGSTRWGVRRLAPHSAPGRTDAAELDRVFTEALDRAFDRMFAEIGDRQIVIPLSGGLDSRLLAVAMHDRGHRNVVNFTYGAGRTREVGISEEVATKLGQRWEFIEYTNAEIREAWASPAAGAFVRDAYAGASLPHVQDWYPVQQLQARGLISDDAVFLPGHTVVGNMHDEQILANPAPLSRHELIDTLLRHHATLKPNARALLKSQPFMAKLNEFLDSMNYDGSPDARLDVLEYWNIIERQTKYINNSMRGYEHFGNDWALPMLDREVLDVWATFDRSVAQDRDWYRAYVNTRYARATGESINTFEAFAAANVSQGNRDRIKTVLRAVGLLTPIERRITARAYAQHPMGFQEFVGATTPEEVRKFILRGGQPMGIYAQRFLDDTWTPDAKLFDRD
ncbi:asparagine synthase (glutamine-hydrolysing) [Leucobacter komagatae]|uniref:asparagine synthase (glutamine-hydrolyzing) n=1 Tax=Leucobacter komagatae TaxID=55969 RepID=A0A542Y6V4_9MICO|nr:asparagine synthase-related protein [Leucobacter komagatae]TQL43796.1 asparagine synthase (glutamine-hydrolysing) [Leucobacter komagatae]